MNLCKRNNETKQYLSHLHNTMSLIDSELRELGEKVSSKEIQLEGLLKQAMRDRAERNEAIARHQQVIEKRKEDEVVQAERSKEYVARLDEMDRIKEFR